MTAFRFVPLAVADIPLVHRWFHVEPVLRWYARRPHTLEEVHVRYIDNIRGHVPTFVYIAHFDGRPGGMIKTYKVADYPEYDEKLSGEPGWAGIDYFIGEDDLRSRGLGADMIAAFVRQIVFEMDGVSACVSGPDPENRPSWRVLEKVGFRHLRDVAMPSGEFERLMLLPKPGSG